MTDGRISDSVEVVASLIHSEWVSWASTITRTETISAARRTRWSRLFIPYAELPETEKERDREWARKVLAAIHTLEGPYGAD